MSNDYDYDSDYEPLDDAGDDMSNVALPDDPDTLSNNTLAFIALANEYCATAEGAATAHADTFVTAMLRLLPRLYIAATDIHPAFIDDGSDEIAVALDEGTYTAVQSAIAGLLGADDTFLEVFEEDMQYSDTPIAASISENLADLFQVFYDFLETVRNAPNPVINQAMSAVKASFDLVWSRTLTNVLRPLNAIKYQS